MQLLVLNYFIVGSILFPWHDVSCLSLLWCTYCLLLVSTFHCIFNLICLRPLTLQAVYPVASVLCLFRKLCRSLHTLPRLLRLLHYSTCAQNKGRHSFLLLLLGNVHQGPVLSLQTDHFLQAEKSQLFIDSIFQDNSENSIFVNYMDIGSPLSCFRNSLTFFGTRRFIIVRRLSLSQRYSLSSGIGVM